MSEKPEKDIVEILRDWAAVMGNVDDDAESHIGAACYQAANEIELWRRAYTEEVLRESGK